MSIEENIARLADAQERTATALEALLAHVGSSAASFTPDPSKGTVAASADEAAAAKEAADKKAKADAAAKKKAEAEAAAKKKAEEEAAAAAAIDPLGDELVEEKEYSIDDVRKALMDYRAIEGAPAMMEVLKTHGKADSLGAVKPENFKAILIAVDAIKG